MKRLLTLAVLLLLGGIFLSAQATFTVENLSGSIFNQGFTPNILEGANGYTYIVGRDQAIRTLGVQAPRFFTFSQPLRSVLGVVDSTLVLQDTSGAIVTLEGSGALTNTGILFGRVEKVVRYGSGHYFIGIATGETRASIWGVNISGSVTRLLTLPLSFANLSTIRLLPTSNGLLAEANQRIYKIDTLNRLGTELVGYSTSPFGFSIQNTVAELGALSYFLIGGKVYQTDGTRSGTGVVLGIPAGQVTNLCVHRSRLYLGLYNRTNLPPSSSNQIVIRHKMELLAFDGVSVRMQKTIFNTETNSPLDNGLNDLVSFAETDNGRLYILAGDFEREAGDGIKLLRLIGTDSLSADLLNTVEKQYLLHGIRQLGSKLVFGVGVRGGFPALRRNTGYFELDTISNIVSQIKVDFPVAMASSNGAVFMLAGGRFQRLVACPGSIFRPTISNMSVDTVGFDIVLRWTDNTDRMTTRYDIYESQMPFPVISSSLFGSVLRSSVSAVDGQMNYTATFPRRSGNLLYNFSIQAISDYGPCSDTIVRLGGVRICQNPEPFNTSFEIISNQFNATTVTFFAYDNLYYAVDSVALLRNGVRIADFPRASANRYTFIDNNFSTLNVYSIVVFSNDPCLPQYTVAAPSSSYGVGFCGSLRPVVTRYQIGVDFINQLCPSLYTNIRIQIRASMTKIVVKVNGVPVDTVDYDNIGYYSYIKNFPASVGSTYRVTLVSILQNGCQNETFFDIPGFNNSNLVFSIDNFSAQQIPGRSQIRLSWDIPAHNEDVIRFVIYRNSQILAYRTATSQPSQSYSLIDSLLPPGIHDYHVLVVSNGNCSYQAFARGEMVCVSTDKKLLQNIGVVQTDNVNSYISWSVSGPGRTLTSAYVRTDSGMDSLFFSEETNGLPSTKYVARYICTDNLSKTITLKTMTGDNVCTSDTKTLTCNCGSLRQISPYAYPNPASNSTRIVFSELSKAQVSLYDATGKLLQHFSDVTVALDLDLSSLVRGLYFVRIAFPEKLESVRLVVGE